MSIILFCLMSAVLMACFGYEDMRTGVQKPCVYGCFIYAGGFLLVGALYAMYLGGVFGG